ncbi:MAG: endonuclease/exonuclease/phosphatase family protein [Bacteroidales bacterium]|jgi:endonuclease/exonuclease/phosphatase family metal-dependent hydrolase|nr:endonuclease/exonuclease/phosphatase family protein [Bacteroidales bacterium]
MKVKIVCLFLLIVSPTFLQAQESPFRLKILCYNLRFGELASLEELATFIKEQDPDVVALQEVDCRTYRDRAPQQHGKDFITELGFRTGLLTAYGKTIPYAGGYYGIGILSKYPLACVERIYLPMTENGKEQRAVLVADVEFQEGHYFTFACTHLDYTNTKERQVQVEKLNRVLSAKPYPVIVAGDFNATPDAKEINEGMKAWKPVCRMESTVPAEAPVRQIDYIFCYPHDKWNSIEATTYRIQLSDHLPISAVVELKRTTK